MKRALALVTLALVLAGCGSSTPDGPVNFGTPAEYARALFDGVNEQRVKNSLTQLAWNDCLADKALPRAADALPEDTLSHEPLQASCTGEVATGENLSRGPFTAEQIVDKWMASPGHEANIVRPGFADAAVGCVAMSPTDPTQQASNADTEYSGYACSLLFEGGE